MMVNQQVTYRYINNYIEVFSCLFMHDYYRSRICNELTIQPTQASLTLIKDFQLVFKSTPGGFSLAANSAKDYSSGVFREPFDLNFEFRFTNPHFFSFTSLLEDPEARYYLEDDLLPSVLFDSHFQNISPALDRAGITGILSVKHLPSAPLLPLDGTQQGGFAPRSKAVYLQSREVQPVYICYTNGDNLSQFEGLAIQNEGAFRNLTSFGQPDQIKTRSGMKAFKFTFPTTLPMRDSWPGYFRLERNNQLGSYSKILPNPSPQNIKYDSINKTFISENYVKL
jgi:hypothetical protein